MKVAANLNWLFTDRPMEERFPAAREAGFEAVELLNPYEHAPETLRELALDSHLPVALINTPQTVDGVGRVGSAAVPGEEAVFREGFRRAVHYARALIAEKIHVLSGVTAVHDARETLVKNLYWAVEHSEGVSLTLEPLNTHDTPGYFLSNFELAAGVIAEVDHPNLGLQFDIYHAEMIGDALALWDKFQDIITHVQLGGAPGRIEPHWGKLDLAAFAAALGRSGYNGVVSGEYGPKGVTEDGLDWMQILNEGWRHGQ